MKPEIIYDARATLGEGPAWDAKTQTLYWVDILEKRVYYHRDGDNGFTQLDDWPRQKTGRCSLPLTHPFWNSILLPAKRLFSQPSTNPPTTASTTANVTRQAVSWLEP